MHPIIAFSGIELDTNNREMTFTIMPETKIMIAGKEAMLADVKKDSKVAVTYKWEGKKRVATTVKIG